MSSDGFIDFSIGDGDGDVGKRGKRFKAESDRTYRATFGWLSVKVDEDGKPSKEGKSWDDLLAFDEDQVLHPDAQVRFTGCERVYTEAAGYILYKSPAYAQFGSVKQTVGTVLIVWPTDKSGDLDVASYAAGKGYSVQPWIFATDKYHTIGKSHKRFSLVTHDLSMSCPVDGGKFQKLTFTPENESLFQKLLASDKPQYKEVVGKLIRDIRAVAASIHAEMARDLTIDQVREILGGEVEGPSSSSNHASKDVEDLLSEVL